MLNKPRMSLLRRREPNDIIPMVPPLRGDGDLFSAALAAFSADAIGVAFGRRIAATYTAQEARLALHDVERKTCTPVLVIHCDEVAASRAA